MLVTSLALETLHDPTAGTDGLDARHLEMGDIIHLIILERLQVTWQFRCTPRCSQKRASSLENKGFTVCDVVRG